jgi:hypothetical protein
VEAAEFCGNYRTVPCLSELSVQKSRMCAGSIREFEAGVDAGKKSGSLFQKLGL